MAPSGAAAPAGAGGGSSSGGGGALAVAPPVRRDAMQHRQPLPGELFAYGGLSCVTAGARGPVPICLSFTPCVSLRSLHLACIMT